MHFHHLKLHFPRWRGVLGLYYQVESVGKVNAREYVGVRGPALSIMVATAQCWMPLHVARGWVLMTNTCLCSALFPGCGCRAELGGGRAAPAVCTVQCELGAAASQCGLGWPAGTTPDLVTRPPDQTRSPPWPAPPPFSTAGSSPSNSGDR